MKSDSDMIKPPINEAKQKIMSNMNIVQKQFKMQKTAMKWIIRELCV
jgi:hypothetical protein